MAARATEVNLSRGRATLRAQWQPPPSHDAELAGQTRSHDPQLFESVRTSVHAPLQ